MSGTRHIFRYWPWKCLSSSPKVNLTRVQGDFYVNQLISGHGTLAAYQNRFLSSSPRSHGGTFHAGIRPTHVLGGNSGPQLCLSGLLLQLGHSVFGRLRAGRNDN
ncbi:hypothetical protein CEXT_24571 [Caerostris extrusa]|uniref:Uncharacterized protein n=1 Tax=Caerostris extrusa TaxID=172846 RepID=A0AAV4M3U7_CAEEX|nr:hypothetical protein CEXT_24571 [Caerostris extrusa]